ncbi:expressed unknown protein [Seminavis robusta]|uniref:Uncharacterized protein n=1 Tax=Seminavis robusta TaxID=568900 RepID=A0A9N8EGZ8_9STRA|nr:expressed unknown protein [Seminavis robusta]|eukprot:Sro1082_g239220.1 n/a (160) ;mRNA; r:25856-26450
MTRMTYSGLVCCHTGIDFENVAICCFSQGDVLCLRNSCCCTTGVESRGCGLTTKPDHGELCKIGCMCCDMGLVKPQVLCAESSQVCCVYNVQTFPFIKEHQSEPVLAYVCLQCMPTVGCCADPGECRALDHVFKEKNLEIYPGTMPNKEAPMGADMDRE